MNADSIPKHRCARRGFRTLSLLLVMLLPQIGVADWVEFIPKPFENGAELRGFGSWERDDNTTGSNRITWDDTFLRQKFSFYSRGYSYHPRFIQYYLLLSGILKQEKYSSTFTGPGDWSNGSGFEYNLRFYVFPEHRYTAEIFASRLEPLFKERSAIQHEGLETSHGVLFNYKDKPYFFNGQYTADTIESTSQTSRIRTIGGGGSYFKEFGNGRIFSVSGNYNHPTFENSSDLDGSRNEYFINNLIQMRRLTVGSDISNSTFDQSSPDQGLLNGKLFGLRELATINLPLNFRALGEYQYRKSTNNVEFPGAIVDERSTNRKDLQFTINHRLYQSLDTRYSIQRNVTDSDGGSSKGLSQYASVNYLRLTPIGALAAGVDAGRSRTKSAGGSAIVNESHAGVAVPGSFLLNEPQQVDASSVQVFLKSPLPPNEIILLQENIHYTITPEANTFRINIISLPTQFVIPETYDFSVTYSLFAAKFDLRTDTLGFHVSYDLFRTLQPYYSYSTTRPDTISGSLPGFEFDSTLQLAGLIFHRAGFNLLGEYQRLAWELSPFRGYRFEARYSGPLSPTTTFSGAAEYMRKYYPLGSASPFDTAYTDRRTSLTARLQKSLFGRNLNVSIGGSYSRYEALTEGSARSLNSSLVWRIGKLDLALGATAYEADAHGFGAIDQRRTHQYYFFNIGRKLL